MENFRKYVLGRKFILGTDHKAIIYMNNTKEPCGRLLKWGLKLQEYDYKIEYIEGEKNGADGLSRYCVDKTVNNLSNIKLSSIEKEELLNEVHIKSGHGTSNTMKFLLKDKIIWSDMYKEIDNYVKKCKICTLAGGELSNTKNRVILSSNDKDLWVVDLIGPIKGSDDKRKFIFTAVNHYNKWLEAKVINNKNEMVVAQCIEELIFKKHEIPKRIISDNGKEFHNKIVKSFVKRE